jgi:methionine biosynthesis protein MetW
MDTSAFNREIYERETKFGSSYNQTFEERTRKVIGIMKGFKGSFLDVGCGDGSMTARICSELGCRAKAVELIKENVSKARQKGIDAKQVDLNRKGLPFASEEFGAVFAGEVLEHVVDSEGLLDDIRRVLKKNGVLVVSVPNIASWYNRMLLLFGFLPLFVESGSREAYGTPFGEVNGHVKAFTKKSIVEMLEKNGFVVERVSGSGFSKTDAGLKKGKAARLAPLFFLTERIASKSPGLATNILVKARKA